jgi:hypothetical protein
MAPEESNFAVWLATPLQREVEPPPPPGVDACNVVPEESMATSISQPIFMKRTINVKYSAY